MPRRDLRNLPEPVLRRLAEHELLDGYGVAARGNLVEAGWDQRARPTGQRLEARAAADGTVTLDGYATVYETPYEVMGGKASSWGWDETIVSGSADKSLTERDDVYLLFDHDGHALGATKNGTLQLSSDRVGLLVGRAFDGGALSDAENLKVVSRVQDGTYDAMSFAFTVVRQEWNADYTERFITELRLWDVSVVKWPANPATHIHARAAAPAPIAGFPLALAQRQADALRLRR
jgi:uncharacterized protein